MEVVSLASKYNSGPAFTNIEDRWFMLALLLSLIVHSSVLLFSKNKPAQVSAQAPLRAVKVSLNLLQQQEAQRQKLIKPPPKAIPKKTVQSKDRPRAKPVSKPVQEKKIPATAPVVAPRVIRGDGDRVVVIRQDYLSDLVTHIEGFKYYPAAARRRGLTGDVNVSFQLLNAGGINALHVRGGPMLLRLAAKQTVQQALPMPSPPPEIKTPRQVSFVMEYQLH